MLAKALIFMQNLLILKSVASIKTFLLASIFHVSLVMTGTKSIYLPPYMLTKHNAKRANLEIDVG